MVFMVHHDAKQAVNVPGIMPHSAHYTDAIMDHMDHRTQGAHNTNAKYWNTSNHKRSQF